MNPTRLSQIVHPSLSYKMMLILPVLGIVLLVGVFAWWSGFRLVRLQGDPLLRERVMTRNKNVAYLTIVGICSIFVIEIVSRSRALAPWAIPLLALSLAVGSFPARKHLLQERWSVGTYLKTMGRFWFALVVFWLVLSVAPHAVQDAGSTRWPVAGCLALLLLVWSIRYPDVFLTLVGARRQSLGPAFSEISRRAGIHPPRLFTLDFQGGRVVNAFALPSWGSPAVVFTDSTLELFTIDEQVAIFAHEVAHLEWFTPSRLLRAELFVAVLIGIATFGTALLPTAVTNWMVVGWPLVLFVVWTSRQSRSRQQEHRADQRAVSLCGDREALAAALVKLHTLMLLPRRWGTEVERGSTHPSLAHRLQAMGTSNEPDVAGTDWPAVFAARDPRIFLVFQSDRLSWFTGVPSGTSPDANAIRMRASSSRTFLYADLVELRVHVGIWGQPSLVWVTHAGGSWAASVQPPDIARLQTTLDSIDTKLASLPARFPFRRWLARGLSLLLVILGGMAVPNNAMYIALFAAGSVGVLIPSPTALGSAAAIAAGTAAFTLKDAARLSGAELRLLTGLFGVAAACLWLARRREGLQTRWEVFLPIGLTTGAILLVYAALSWWAEIPMLTSAPVWVPDALQLLFGVICGLLTAWNRTRRWSPLVALAGAVFLYAFGVGWLGPLRLHR